MANVYVWSGAVGTGTGADWTNAYTSLVTAAAAKLAGDVFFVAHDHAETAAAHKYIVFPGTTVSPNKVYCVNRAGSVPPVAADLRTTASISTTGGVFDIKTMGCVDFYGIIFTAGDATNPQADIFICSANANVQRLTNCSLRLGTNHTDSGIYCPDYNNGTAYLENTTIQFGGNANDQSLYVGGDLIWRNTNGALIGANIPNYILDLTFIGASAYLEGIDLSAASTSRFLYFNRDMSHTKITLKDCRLGQFVTIPSANTTYHNNSDVQIFRCDSTNATFRNERHNPDGDLTTEVVIVHSGGASDGLTSYSWKIVTSAITKWEFPFECFPITPITSFINETGPIQSVTVQGIWGGAAVPNNDDIWIDVEYLGTFGYPQAVKGTSNKANGLVVGTPLPAGTGIWGGSTTKFQMTANFDPYLPGPITVYVRAAKPSSTFYIDPKAIIQFGGP